MTRKTNAAADPAPAEMPSEGGSYVRGEDGKLTHVEYTEQAAPADADTPVDGEPPVDGAKTEA